MEVYHGIFGNIIKGSLTGSQTSFPAFRRNDGGLGIYDRLIGAVSGLFKEFKKNVAFLIPIIIGCGSGSWDLPMRSNICSTSTHL